MPPIASADTPSARDPALARITAHYAIDETTLVRELAAQAALPPAQRDLVVSRATELVARVRAKAAPRPASKARLNR